MLNDLNLTHDCTINAQLLRSSFFNPERTWLIAPHSVPYLDWLLVPVTHPKGWTLEVHSPTYGICINSEIYPSSEAAIEAGPEFVNRWFTQLALLELAS